MLSYTVVPKQFAWKNFNNPLHCHEKVHNQRVGRELRSKYVPKALYSIPMPEYHLQSIAMKE
jgi:hypothetical protein